MSKSELKDKEQLYCHLMRKAFIVALKDREASNRLNSQARQLKQEIQGLRKQVNS